MKHSKHHDNVRGGGPPLESVRFEYTHPTAVKVCVAGTFNDWDADSKPMHAQGNGLWRKDTVLPAGTHEYRLIVDGEWIPDPAAKETVANPFGGRNSLITVVTIAPGVAAAGA